MSPELQIHNLILTVIYTLAPLAVALTAFCMVRAAAEAVGDE